MKTFKISGLVTVSCYTEVEAESAAAALEIAASRQIADFHIDGSYTIDECFHIEADGTPRELRIEE